MQSFCWKPEEEPEFLENVVNCCSVMAYKRHWRSLLQCDLCCQNMAQKIVHLALITRDHWRRWLCMSAKAHPLHVYLRIWSNHFKGFGWLMRPLLTASCLLNITRQQITSKWAPPWVLRDQLHSTPPPLSKASFLGTWIFPACTLSTVHPC